MYRINIEYGPMEPDNDGMILTEASEECKDEADVLAAVEYWLSQSGVSDIHIKDIYEK